ncbi:hypothetical protein AC579_4154 [Pseudocercospora musae]|uniref:Hydrophobic surface binding protein n=1 Tax=Pseudocercospora musae TaxID=113226 RepID=A0A139IG20_9PEZI|nr:hypothetical protein AC579_4154 [Pseudocercospora musae]
MIALSRLLLLATSVTALVLPRNAAKIQADLETLNQDYNSLKQADQSHAAGGDALSVQSAVDKVSTDTTLATTDAKLSTTLSNSDSQAINSYISGTLEPSIKAAIQATEANKVRVAKAGLTRAVQAELKQLKDETDALGNALVAITLAKAGVSDLNKVFAKIDVGYDEGITAFS